MKQQKAKPGKVTALFKGMNLFNAGLVLVWCANYLTAKWLGYPFLYCWGHGAAMAVYEPFAQLASLIAIANLFVHLVRFNVMGALIGALIMVVVMGLPTYADTFFRLGGSCG